jgi:hypothetical protein
MEIIESINRTATHPVPEERYKQLFEALWPDFEKKIGIIPKTATTSKQTRTQAEILEELVGAIRSMESRVRDVPDESRSTRRRNKLHPMMLHELGNMLSERPGDPVNILVFASALRDDAPWLYELGMEAYRLASSGKSAAGKTAMQRFSRAVEFSMRGPFPPEEYGLDPRMHHRLLRDLQHALEFETEQVAGSREKKPKVTTGTP